MELSGTQFFILFGSSFISVSFLTALMRRIAIRFGVVDAPNESHKAQKEPIPYLGGVAIVLGVLAVTISSIIFSDYQTGIIWLAISVLLPASILSIIGLIDDVRKLSPWPRFLAQTSVAIISAYFLTITDTLGSPTGSDTLDTVITVFWIVGLANAVNFFDNVDGGASTSIAISSGVLASLAFQGGQIFISALAVVLCGATLGFLVWNKPPARIYMGDAGSLFLGVLMASLTIRLDLFEIETWASFAIPIMIMAMPILDTCVVVTKRLWRGSSPFQGGRDHLSHRLIRQGNSKRKSILILSVMTLLFGIIAILISHASARLSEIYLGCGLIFWVSAYVYFLRTSDN